MATELRVDRPLGRHAKARVVVEDVLAHRPPRVPAGTAGRRPHCATCSAQWLPRLHRTGRRRPGQRGRWTGAARGPQVLTDCIDSFEYLQHECDAPISGTLALHGTAESELLISPRTRNSQQRLRVAAVESHPERLRLRVHANLSAAVTRAVAEGVRAWLAQVRAAVGFPLAQTGARERAVSRSWQALAAVSDEIKAALAHLAAKSSKPPAGPARSASAAVDGAGGVQRRASSVGVRQSSAVPAEAEAEAEAEGTLVDSDDRPPLQVCAAACQVHYARNTRRSSAPAHRALIDPRS